MSIRIAEVDAAAAARPRVRAFDRNALLGKPPFPRRKLILADRESHMQRAVTGVTRNDTAAGNMHGLAGDAFLENQQHAVASNRVGGQPLVAEDRLQFE